MRVTMLMDNISAAPGIIAEHGLSLYIETEKHRILFDTGSSDAFARNAETLGIDLAAVDIAFISHGHYDHTRGLPRFFELNDRAPVYIHREAFEEYHASDERNIGMPAQLKGNSRFILTDGSLRIDDELSLASFNDEPRPFPSHSGGLLMRRSGQDVQDEFRHEQYLSIREAGSGRHTVISGCSHKGILNILEWFRPDVLVGGFHFKQLPPDSELLRRYGEAMAKYDTVFYTGHCTGQEQYAVLKTILGDRLHALSTGSVTEL